LWCNSLNSLRSGNWTVDLQAGSEFGYKLLFVILLAGLGAARESRSKLNQYIDNSSLSLEIVCRYPRHDDKQSSKSSPSA
jgi:hypothetical protein